MKNKEKLIFGLSPRETIIHAIILSFISMLSWDLKFIEQIPVGLNFKNILLDDNLLLVDNVPWYYYITFTIASMFLSLTWIMHIFNIKYDDYSLRAIRYKYLYTILGTLIIQAIAKFTFLFLLILIFR